MDQMEGVGDVQAAQDALGFTLACWVLEVLFIDMGKGRGRNKFKASRDSG